MNEGARSTDQWREHRALLEAISRNREETTQAVEPQGAPAPPPPDAGPQPLAVETMEPITPWRDIFVGAILLLMAALWIAAVGATLEAGASPLTNVTALISMASGPLALLGVVFIVLQRTSRREAARFGQTAQAMRIESANLERTIAALADRIAENRAALAEQTQQLLHLGEDSSLRLSEITATMARESKALRVEAEHLETAAEIARSDLGVVIDDLPRVDEQVRAITALIREAGGETQARVSELREQLAALAEQGEKADAVAGGAAERLAEQIARTEQNSAEAGQKLNAAAEALGSRLEEIGERIDALSARLATQDQASRMVLDGIDRSLDEMEGRFVELTNKGRDATRGLSEALAALREQEEGVTGRLGAAAPAAEALIERASALRAALDASTEGIGNHIPAALESIEEKALRSHAAIAAIVPEATALERAVAAATADIGGTGTAIAAQRTAVEAMQQATAERLSEIRRQSSELQASIAEVEQTARQLAENAGPQLVEALLRVRETAVQAAERARESLGTVIPDAAASIGSASREAVEKAMNETIRAQLAEIAASAEEAVTAATSAGDRLERQLAAIRDTAAAVDARVDEVQVQVANADENSFSRRVALLIESLNSTSIDVAKILSNEITDSAWTSYLKGDRSVFTRRAVRLIDTTEAREISRHYEEEPEFREQVNRYVHDFEGMLRRVLSSRDGAPLSVTLLSSDMGKLYVALAQAIERLRT